MGPMRTLHVESLDLAQLRLLEGIGRTGSVSTAAEEMGLSQPAASHALRRMRQLLGDELFVRTPRGMLATARGAHICTAIVEALGTLRDALEAREPFVAATSKRTFRLYMSDVGQLVMLPALLAHLRRHAPNVRLHVAHVPLRDPSRALELGEVDLAVGHIRALTSGFRQRTLFSEKYVCVASADNDRFSGGMSLEAFTDSPHALADSSGMAHGVVEDAFARHGVLRQFGLVVPEFMTLPFVIAGSDLVVTMPSRLAERFAELAPLRVMAPPIRLEPYPIRAFWHERAHREAANAWLRGVLAELFARPAPRANAGVQASGR